MDARLQRRVQRYGWDRAAAHYEPGWAESLAPAVARVLERARLGRGERVLDVASGSGLVALPAARAVGPEGRVLGIDLSSAMVDLLRERASREGLANLEVAQGDAETLAVAAASYDVALCSLGLMYVPDPRRALGEMRRALRPGGRLVVSVWGARDRCGWAELFPIVDRRVKSDVCPLFFQLGTAETFHPELAETGFTDIALERLDVAMTHRSGQDACDAAFLGGPVALAFSRFDEATRAAACEEYLASIADFRSEGGSYLVPGEIVVASARVE